MNQFALVRSFPDQDIERAAAQVSLLGDMFWNKHPQRTDRPDSPHRETDDIWLRYRDPAELHSPEDFRGPHFPIWYPAWSALTRLHPIVYDLAASVRAVHIGGCLITRIPPGKQVYSHDDRGAWHAEYHNTKIWVPLAANERCYNRCRDEEIIMRPGQAWTFNNLEPHSVRNEGDSARVTLICSFRTEPA